MQQAGQVCIVTGGASGIGRALAQELARRGAKVVVTDVDLAGANTVATAINAMRADSASATQLDVTDADAVAAVVNQTRQSHGRIDMVVNNAGISIEYGMPQTQLKKVSFALDSGSFFDGWRNTITLTPTWYVSKFLELTGEYEYSRIRFPDRDQALDVHVSRLRIGTALNTMLSANAFIQYNSAADRFSTNLRLRYNFREGNDLWIVYDEQLNSDRNRFSDIAVLPVSGARTLIVKYTYTFAL